MQDEPRLQDDDEVVQEDDLPFTWKKLALENDEESLDEIELVQAWVVDVPDPKHIAAMLTWLKRSGLDKNDALSHLKRVRRQGTLATLLLDVSIDPPSLPSTPALDPPYQLPVPSNPARTPAALALKNTYWPTALCPRRKWEPETWTRARAQWASDAVRHLKSAHAKRKRDLEANANELPVVAHVPIPYLDDAQNSRPFFAYDTRASSNHPLRHAALDVIRQVADARAQRAPAEDDPAKNGAQYLLTGLSLFITHEPCIMCTMALLHSRVKDVFYLEPMPQTGGCGGAACVPALKGVNHRFNISLWKTDPHDPLWPAPLNPSIDV